MKYLFFKSHVQRRVRTDALYIRECVLEVHAAFVLKEYSAVMSALAQIYTRLEDSRERNPREYSETLNEVYQNLNESNTTYFMRILRLLEDFPSFVDDHAKD